MSSRHRTSKSARSSSAWVTLQRVWSSLDGVPCDAEPTHATYPDRCRVEPRCRQNISPFRRTYAYRKESHSESFVRDDNVDQALRILKKKLQRDGLFREIKRRRAYEKPSQRKAREKGEAIRRGRKAARKLAQREGLIASPRPRAFGRRSA